jgi:hypothetical protein
VIRQVKKGVKLPGNDLSSDHLAIEDCDVPFLSFENLIINNIVAGRLKDQADVEELQKIHHVK